MEILPGLTLENLKPFLYNLAILLSAGIALLIVLRFLSVATGKLEAVLDAADDELESGTKLMGIRVLQGLIRIIRLLLTLSVLYLAGRLALPLISEEWIRTLAGNLLEVALLSIAFVWLFGTLKAVSRFLKGWIVRTDTTWIREWKIQQLTVVTRKQIQTALALVIRSVIFVIAAAAVYSYLTLLFGIFEFTRDWSVQLSAYLMAPVKTVAEALIGFLPNVFFIAIIVLITFYSVRFNSFLFREISQDRIRIPGFYSDWSIPTSRIVSFVIIAFAVIVIFPYLPGAKSDAFKGISIFLGFLFSLGSAGIIGNIVAGIVVTYMRPFQTGDRVQIADTTGTVIEKTLLVTRIKTPKNVYITIPNGMVLSSHIINFSTSSKEEGLILHTTVTIGYDVAWEKVHKTLTDAAAAVDGISSEPKPFVLQTALNDFHVSYELNAYTGFPEQMTVLYSELHKEIQKKCAENGIEILSPHYNAYRDGSESTIPGKKKKRASKKSKTLKTGADIVTDAVRQLKPKKSRPE